MIRSYAEEVALRQKRLDEEHTMLRKEKELHLATLRALAAHRTVRRPLVVKILTISIVRDKHDRLVEAQIAALEKEIAEWR